MVNLNFDCRITHTANLRFTPEGCKTDWREGRSPEKFLVAQLMELGTDLNDQLGARTRGQRSRMVELPVVGAMDSLNSGSGKTT